MSLNSNINRRKFLEKSTKGAIGLTAGLAASGMIPSSSYKVKAETPKAKSSMKITLYNVSFSGVWYDGPALNPKEFILKSKELGYEAIEIGLKRPYFSPLDLDKRKCEEIKMMTNDAGLEIGAVASYNSFASPVPERRENELLMVREQIRLATFFGVKILRIFAAWTGVTMDKGFARYDEASRAYSLAFLNVTREQKWGWVMDCLKESTKYAEDFGVVLALQNHKPLINSYRDVNKMVREINSPNLKASLDLPLFENQNEEHIKEAVRDTGDLMVHTHIGGEFKRNPDGSIEQMKYRDDRELYKYPVFLKAIAERGYNGCLAYELCHPLKIEGRHGTIKDSEDQIVMAREYLEKILANI